MWSSLLHRNVLRITSLCCVLVMTLSASAQTTSKKAAQNKTSKSQTKAEKVLAALNKKYTIDYVGQSLGEVMAHIEKKTGVKFAVDRASGARYLMRRRRGGGGFPGPAGPPGVPRGPGGDPEPPPPFPGRGQAGNPHLKITKAALYPALNKFLARYNLTCVVLQSGAMITSRHLGLARQMHQKVDINFKGISAEQGLKQLQRQTGVKLLLDPNVGKSKLKKVTLKLDNVTLQNAIRLTAFLGGMKSVRVGNTVVVTTGERAKLLPAERRLPNPSNYGAPDYPEGIDDDGPPPPVGAPPMAVPGGIGGGAAPAVVAPVAEPAKPAVPQKADTVPDRDS